MFPRPSRLRHCLCRMFPLPSWLRQRLFSEPAVGGGNAPLLTRSASRARAKSCGEPPRVALSRGDPPNRPLSSASSCSRQGVPPRLNPVAATVIGHRIRLGMVSIGSAAVQVVLHSPRGGRYYAAQLITGLYSSVGSGHQVAHRQCRSSAGSMQLATRQQVAGRSSSLARTAGSVSTGLRHSRHHLRPFAAAPAGPAPRPQSRRCAAICSALGRQTARATAAAGCETHT